MCGTHSNGYFAPIRLTLKFSSGNHVRVYRIWPLYAVLPYGSQCMAIGEPLREIISPVESVFQAGKKTPARDRHPMLLCFPKPGILIECSTGGKGRRCGHGRMIKGYYHTSLEWVCLTGVTPMSTEKEDSQKQRDPCWGCPIIPFHTFSMVPYGFL